MPQQQQRTCFHGACILGQDEVFGEPSDDEPESHDERLLFMGSMPKRRDEDEEGGLDDRLN